LLKRARIILIVRSRRPSQDPNWSATGLSMIGPNRAAAFNRGGGGKVY
jgi:hypothetical protein